MLFRSDSAAGAAPGVLQAIGGEHAGCPTFGADEITRGVALVQRGEPGGMQAAVWLRARYRVMNWPAYEAGLQRRGNLTVWLDEAARAPWPAPRQRTPGGQPIYSDLAIELVLSLRLVFHLALRQAAASAASVLRLLGVELPVPEHTRRPSRRDSLISLDPSSFWRQSRKAGEEGP